MAFNPSEMSLISEASALILHSTTQEGEISKPRFSHSGPSTSSGFIIGPTFKAHVVFISHPKDASTRVNILLKKKN